MATGGDATKGYDAEVRIITCNGIMNGLIEGLERGRSLDVLMAGALRWWNQ